MNTRWICIPLFGFLFACDETMEAATTAVDIALSYGRPNVGCSSEGAARTQLVLTGRETGTIDERTVTCGPGSSVVSYEGLPEDVYDLRAYAFAPDDSLVFELDGARTAVVRAVLGASTEYDLVLARTKGDLTLRWSFDQGQGCGTAVQVFYVLETEDYVRRTGYAPCADGSVEIPAIAWGEIDARIHAQDSMDITISENRGEELMVRASVANVQTMVLHPVR